MSVESLHIPFVRHEEIKTLYSLASSFLGSECVNVDNLVITCGITISRERTGDWVDKNSSQ